MQGQITLEFGGGIWPKFELIQAFMHFLVTCKNEVDPIKNEGARVFTRYFHYKFYGDFSRRSRAVNSAVLGPIWPNFELVRNLMDVLVTCKYEEDPIKKEGARVFTRFFPHYNPMGAMCCHRNQSSNPIWPKTQCSLSPTPIMLLLKFDCDWPTGHRDIHV